MVAFVLIRVLGGEFDQHLLEAVENAEILRNRGTVTCVGAG
ncbi:MAG: hypothetical protein ABI137_12805 [Antricoccus sp.]